MKRSASKNDIEEIKAKLVKKEKNDSNNNKLIDNGQDIVKISIDDSLFPENVRIAAKIYSNYEQALINFDNKSLNLSLFFMTTLKINVKQNKYQLEGENAQQQFIIYQEKHVKKSGKKILASTTTNNFYLLNESNNTFALIHSDDEDDKNFINLMSLHASKLVAFVLNKDLKSNNSIYIDVYLTNNLWFSDFTLNPSQFVHIKQSYRTLSIIFGKFLQNEQSDEFMDRFIVNGIGPFSNLNENEKEELMDVENNDLLNDSNNLTQREHDDLFDLIYYHHKKENIKIVGELNTKQLQIFNETLNSLKILRQYQIDAIKWMLYKENYFNFVNSYQKISKIHPLFRKIVNKDNKIIYYHKYLGAFCEQMPEHLSSLPGGILADEMGLGKTVEILATILINRRESIPKYEVKYENEVDLNLKKANLSKRYFSCLCGSTDKDLQSSNLVAYQCVSCSVWSHITCTNYTGAPESFLCPRCLTKVKPYPSGCTLIITPSVIMHQWIDEVEKHFKHKNLKVLLYKGCGDVRYGNRYNSNTKTAFMQPKDLADLDICITSYDVLANELSHVTAMDNLKDLRHAKRYMSVPSPLVCVEWWRICLDEAQMVHSTNAKCAEMANRLYAINRWCVTGTPIGRSLNDLHGLFTFIQEDPFYDKRWFTELLYDTYQHGNKRPMINALSNVLWRTSKKFVKNQIDIPKQSEVVHWLNFSQFEKHLYDRCLEIFKDKRNEYQIFDNLNLKLRINQIDRDTLNRILSPLNELRLTCNHPQLILKRGNFLANVNLKKEKVLSMEKSLEILTKKTKNECEQIYRTAVSCINGLAALSIIENKFDEAIEYYRSILKSEKEYENKFSLDSLQKIHTIYNLSEILELKHMDENIDELKNMLVESEMKYMLSYIESRKKLEIDLKDKIKAADSKYKENKKIFNSWWIVLLEFISQDQIRLKDFLEKLMKELSTNTYAFNQHTIDLLHSKYTICGKEFTTIDGLKIIIVDEFDKFMKARSNIQKQLGIFFDDIDENLIKEAADCHLKRNNGRYVYSKNKCELCKCEVLFNQYKKFIFSNNQIDEEAFLTIVNKENEELATADDESNEKYLKKNEADDDSTRQTIGDMEKFFRLILKYCPPEVKLKVHRDVGKEFIEFNGKLKHEFYLMRRFWSSVSNEINSYDEIDMAKIRIRLKESYDRDSKETYLVERRLIPYQILKNKEEKKNADEKLRKKIGQLLYLTNLQKSFSIQNGSVENEEVCPICQMNLEQQWYVLVCGHVFCIECTNRLTDSQTECRCENCLIRNGLNRRNIQCAMCREISRCDEIHLVGNKPVSDNAKNTRDTEFELKGDSNSTKIEGIVKCIMKILHENPQEKCLVFSSYPNMLDLIQESLKANTINHRYLKEGFNSNKNLIDFKTDKNLNVLLVPYSFGASGLNLIEATHIILVEPNLNVGQEAQAIGRIHRLGQNKRTFVHRFLIKNSIEDLIYNTVIKTKSSENQEEQQQDSIFNKAELTIADLISVINNL